MITESLGVGGAERAVTTLAVALAELGYACEIAALWGPYTLAPELRDRGIPFHALDVPHRWNVLAGGARVGQLLRRRQPSIIHAHGYFPLIYSALTRIGWPGPLRLVTFHSVPYVVYAPVGIQRNLRRRLEWVAARNGMDAHIAVSGSVADHVSHHLGLRQARVILNPLETYVLDTPTRETDHDTGERQRTSVCDPPLVACPATLRVEKNHYLLLRAAAQAKRAGTPTRLVLAGDGPLRQSLEAEVARLHLTSDVRLIGRLEHRALIALVRRADLVALSSCAEGGPIAILEAMAQGTAVLSTAVGCLPDVVDHGVSGILVPVGDDDAFCAEFLRLAQDARLRESLGAAGRGSVAARSAPEVVAARHDEVYRLARQIGADQC